MAHVKIKYRWSVCRIVIDKSEVFVTETTGAFITKFGARGKGPEEIQYVSSLGFDSQNNIIIHDPFLNLFKIFSIDGDLKKINRGLLENGLWDRSGKLYIYNQSIYVGIMEIEKSDNHNFWKSAIFAEYNPDCTLQKKVGGYDPALAGSDRLYKYPNIHLDKRTGYIYTTHRILPYIQVFDSKTGEHIARFGLRSPSFNMSAEEARVSDPMYIRRQKNLEQSFVGESFTSDNYFFFYFFNWTEDFYTLQDPNLKEHFVNIFQKKPPYAFLGEIQLPYAPLEVTSDNRIFLLEDDNPDNFKVGIYELVEN